MFEEFEAEEKGQAQERNKLMIITVIILGVIAVVGAIVYLSSGSHAKTAQSAPVAGAAVSQAAADPVKDLRIVKAVMGKDASGIRVRWAVQLRNQSSAYTYSDIQYEARFIGADGSVMSSSRDTIKDSIGPGEEKAIPEFIGGVYNPNASTYQFVIVGATSAK